MKKYYSEIDAPLKFHKFYHYICIPLAFINGLLSLFATIQSITSFNFMYGVDIVSFVLCVVLSAIVFLEFYSFSAKGWYALMAYLVVKILYDVICTVVFAIYVPDIFVDRLITCCTTIFLSALIALYYYKRKPLFFPAKNPIEEKTSPISTPVFESAPASKPEPEPTPEPSPEPVIRFCTNCGANLQDGFAFCPKCGTARYRSHK